MKLDLSNEYFTLNSLIELNVKKDKDKIGEIAMKADKERELEQIFEKVNLDWKKAEFKVKEHKAYYILDSTEEINALLEETMVTLSNILSARFVDHIRKEVEAFYKNMQYMENLLNEWAIFQRSWMYLENIFNGSDLGSKMATDAKKFTAVDTQWKEIMRNTNT